jgi:hypothetical protein
MLKCPLPPPFLAEQLYKQDNFVSAEVNPRLNLFAILAQGCRQYWEVSIFWIADPITPKSRLVLLLIKQLGKKRPTVIFVVYVAKLGKIHKVYFKIVPGPAGYTNGAFVHSECLNSLDLGRKFGDTQSRESRSNRFLHLVVGSASVWRCCANSCLCGFEVGIQLKRNNN